MQIVALVYVSLSELQTIDKKYTDEYFENYPNELEKVLHGLGMDTKNNIEVQELTHRNRFNNIVTCKRWVGNELTTKEWINSGHASQAAIDKSKNSKMLTDLYRLRGAVE